MRYPRQWINLSFQFITSLCNTRFRERYLSRRFFLSGRARLRFCFLHDAGTGLLLSLPVLLFLSLFRSVRLLIMPLHSFVLSFGCARGEAAGIGCLRFPAAPQAENAPGPTCADFKVQSTIAVCRLCSDSFTTAGRGRKRETERERGGQGRMRKREREAVSLLRTEPKNNSS